MIVVIDYDCGNIGSILNMLKKIGAQAKISSSVDDIRNAEKLILPGVGSFDTGISNLKEKAFWEVLNYKALDQKVPILGICLGMQLMTKRSEEGKMAGLGWFDAETLKFPTTSNEGKIRVPHMDWEYVFLQKESKLFKDMYEEPRFYFVHSYYISCSNKEDITTLSNYSLDFVSAFEKDNLYGVQFHPEKSHKYGLKLLQNFSDL